MKFIAAVFVALAISAQADESEYNYYQTQHDQHHAADPYAGYADLTGGYSNSIAEKDSSYPDMDMDVILPIVVFGGLGLGAIAYIDTLNRQNNLCNKLREVTNAMRTNMADGNVAVNIVDPANPAGGVTGLANANTVINSNRLFLNALRNIDNLDC